MKSVPKFETVLIRLPPSDADELRRLAQTTRITQAVYLREAVTDLLAKYREPKRGAR